MDVTSQEQHLYQVLSYSPLTFPIYPKSFLSSLYSDEGLPSLAYCLYFSYLLSILTLSSSHHHQLLVHCRTEAFSALFHLSFYCSVLSPPPANAPISSLHLFLCLLSVTHFVFLLTALRIWPAQIYTLFLIFLRLSLTSVCS